MQCFEATVLSTIFYAHCFEMSRCSVEFNILKSFRNQIGRKNTLTKVSRKCISLYVFEKAIPSISFREKECQLLLEMTFSQQPDPFLTHLHFSRAIVLLTASNVPNARDISLSHFSKFSNIIIK